MAMRTASPWWASLAFATGLLFFCSASGSSATWPGRASCSPGSALLLILGDHRRAVWTMLGSAGARRRVERTLLVCNAGTCSRLVLYLMSTSWERRAARPARSERAALPRRDDGRVPRGAGRVAGGS